MSRAAAQPPCPTDSELDRLRRRYLRRWIFGLIALILLAIPSTIHSAAAIATLRNVPDQWLPATLPLKQDFTEYVRRFGLADVMFISWPGAKLGDDDVRKVTMLLRGVSEEGTELLQDNARSQDSSPDKPLDRFDPDTVPDSVRLFWKDAKELCDDSHPFAWVRSGTEIRDSLTLRPLSLSSRSATRRLQGTFVGPDGDQTCVLASFLRSSGPHQRQLLPLMRSAIADLIQRPKEEVVFVGGSVDGAAVDNEAIASIEKFTVPSSILAAVLCWLCLRSIPLTFTILGIATIGQGMVLAMVFYLGTPMNAILIVLPPLVFVLTVSSGIHLSNYYRDIARHQRIHPVDAARRAMRIGVPPCLTATFTTVVGLMSLYMVRLEPVRMFGVIGSIGVLSTLALLIIMLPGAMVLAKFSPTDSTSLASDKPPVVRSPRWLRPYWILVTFAVLTSFAVVGFGRLTTSVSVPKMFSPDSELRQNYVWYENHVGATMTAELLLSFDDLTQDSTPQGKNEQDDNERSESEINQLRQVIRVHSAIANLPEVGGVLSAVNFLPVLTKSRSVSSTLSRSVIRGQITDQDSDVHTLGYVDRSSGERTWRIELRLFQTRVDDYGSVIDQIKKTATDAIREAPELPSGKVTMTGHVVIVDGTQQLLLHDLFTSFLAAFGVIAILMALYLRSLAGGILAMIPNLIPTLILFGSMGWLRWPLDIGSVMTASVALGIAVDDSVHLLAQYRLARPTAEDRRSAAVIALSHCGWAMLQTTLVCSLSMLVYGLSPFEPTRGFAFFMLGLLALAWIGVSTLLPAIMATRWGDFFATRADRDREE